MRQNPVGNAVTINSDGSANPTATGTATAVNVAITNLHTMMRGVEYLVTTPAANAVAGFRGPSLQWTRGNAAKIGGFTFVCRWGPATGVATATARAFCGMVASTSAPTDVDPSSQTNRFGMAWDAADTNIHIIHNDATSTCTTVDLGATFPVPTVDRAHVYQLYLYCPPNDTYIDWQVTDLVTDAVASGQITSDMPASTALLTWSAWVSVGGTSSVIGIALKSWYIETDY